MTPSFSHINDSRNADLDFKSEGKLLRNLNLKGNLDRRNAIAAGHRLSPTPRVLRRNAEQA
jgi:hypothetical protein